MRVRPAFPARSHKPQLLVAALVPALIVVLSITGFVWAQKDVTVIVDGKTLRIRTQAPSVEALLRDAGIAVDAADLVSPALDTPVKGVSTVLVRHSIPVTVDVGGDRVDLDLVGDTVADALVAVGADPGSTPEVTPAPETPLAPGMQVEVPDAFVRVASEETAVPAPVRYEKDRTLPKGVRQVVRAGRPGKVLHVYRMIVAGGAEGQAILTASRTVTKPRPKVVVVGTGDPDGFSPDLLRAASATPPEGGRAMQVEATGYSPQQPDLDYTTATGAYARRGIIAVDPDVIPLGTRVYVPGYGYAVAEDTGGAIDGRRIDLCFDTVAEALVWGRRRVTIIILD